MSHKTEMGIIFREELFWFLGVIRNKEFFPAFSKNAIDPVFTLHYGEQTPGTLLLLMTCQGDVGIQPFENYVLRQISFKYSCAL